MALNLKKVIKRPGRMRRVCKKLGYPGATCQCCRSVAKQAAKQGDRSLAAAARLCLRLKGCPGAKPIGRKRK